MLSPSLEALETAVKSGFQDVLPSGNVDLLYQVKDDSWGGMYLEIQKDQTIADRSVIKIVVETQTKADVPSDEPHEQVSQ